LRNRVIILEDDPGNAKVLQMMLVRCGFEGLPATSCMEVQAYLKEGGVVALMADLMLAAHGCRGTDVALRSLVTDPQLKILFISGWPIDHWSAGDRENVAALPEGSVDFLPKPFTHHILLDKLNVLLQRTSRLLAAGTCCPEYAGCLDAVPPTLSQIMAAHPSRDFGRTHSAALCW
jgi:DNA-binding response OmpR family regulator